MKKALLLVILALALSVCLAPNVDAAAFGLYAEPGYAVFSPQDINDQIAMVNALMDLAAQQGAQVKKMTPFGGGFDVAAGGQLAIGDALGLRAGVDYLQSGSQGSLTDPQTQQTSRFTLGISALGFGGRVRYSVLTSDALRIDVGGDVGYYNVKVDGAWETPDQKASDSYSAGAVGYGAVIVGAYQISPILSGSASVGYRILSATELKNKDGQILTKDDGKTPATVDLSGLTLRLGLGASF